MSLTKEQFLRKKPRQIQSVELADGSVYVRRLTVAEQTQYEAEVGALDEGDTTGFTAIALAFWMCTEEGEPFLTMAEARDHVKDHDAPEVAAIMRAGSDLNKGLSPKAVEAVSGN